MRKIRSDHGPQPEMAEMVEQHYQVLYGYAYRLCGSVADAEDLTQQTFLQAQKGLSQLRSTTSARGWLFAIARNLYLKQWRSPRLVCLPELDGAEDQASTPSNVLPGDVDPELLERALEELPDAFRVPLVLFYFEELSYREIAGQIGVPLGTVMSRLARAKVHLRSRLFCESQERPADPAPRSARHAV